MQCSMKRYKLIQSKEWIAPAACALISVAVYVTALDLQFCFDDHSAIKGNADLRPSSSWMNLFSNDFWGTPMHIEGSHKSYRPLCVLTFRINYVIHELAPFGYHLVNVLLHAFVTWLFVRLCQKVVLCSNEVALIAGMLFAVHPVHTEAVAGVVGRAESLSAFFSLIGLFAHQKACSNENSIGVRWLLVSLLFCLLSVLSKEQGITMLAIYIIYDVFIVRKMDASTFLKRLTSAPCSNWFKTVLIRCLLVVLFFVCVMAARVRIMASSLPSFVVHDNPAISQPAPVKQLTWLHLCFVNAWLLLNPSKLCPDWTMQTVPLIEGFTDIRNMATLFTFLAFGVLGFFAISDRKQVNQQVLLGLSLIVFPFVPASNLFFPVGFVVAERILYVPSMGFSLLVAVGFSKAFNSSHLKVLAKIALMYILIVHSLKTVYRNRDWYSDMTLFTAAIKVNPNNGKLYSNLGHQYEYLKNYTHAEHLFRRGSEIQPDDPGAFMNLGRVLRAQERLKEAEIEYRKGIALLPDLTKEKKARIAPNHINIYYNLANLLRLNDSKLEEANKFYALATKMKKDFVDAYINRGDVLIKLNKTEEALKCYQKAVHYGPNNAMAYFNLATMYLQMGKNEEAIRSYRETIRIDPSYFMALHNLAHLLKDTGDSRDLQEAIKLFKHLVEVNPEDVKSLSSLALVYIDHGDNEMGYKYLKEALQVDPTSRSALYNIALILNTMGRYSEVLSHLETLRKHHPSHLKAHHLAGEVNYKMKDYEQALQSYSAAISLDSKDLIGWHNLATVYYDTGRLEEAREATMKILELNPSDGKAKNRLKAIHKRLHENTQT